MNDMRKNISAYIQGRQFFSAASLVCAFVCLGAVFESDSKITHFALFFMIGVFCRLAVQMVTAAGAARALRDIHDALQEIESERWGDGK